MTVASFRRDFITRPIFRWARHVLPSLSATEREAAEAGDVWWDADLFSGNPDWMKLLAFPPAILSAEEQAFIDGPVDDIDIVSPDRVQEPFTSNDLIAVFDEEGEDFEFLFWEENFFLINSDDMMGGNDLYRPEDKFFLFARRREL